jgi:hypothetical protein
LPFELESEATSTAKPIPKPLGDLT